MWISECLKLNHIPFYRSHKDVECRGSGLAKILDPCIDKFLETKAYYDACEKHKFVPCGAGFGVDAIRMGMDSDYTLDCPPAH